MRPALASSALAAGLLVLACATATPAQQEWMAKRDQQPTSFVVPAADAAAAWTRAQEWVAKHAEFPITTSNDTVIQTAAGQEEFDARVSITVTRVLQPDGGYKVDVITRTLNPLSTSQAWRTARALAYYVASGVPYPAS